MNNPETDLVDACNYLIALWDMCAAIDTIDAAVQRLKQALQTFEEA